MTDKIDLNEYLRERGHEKGVLDQLLEDARPLPLVLLDFVPTGTPLRQIEAELGKVCAQNSASWDLLKMVTPRRWDLYFAGALVQHFTNLTHHSRELEAIGEGVRKRFLANLRENGGAAVARDDLEIYEELMWLPRNDFGNAQAYSLLFSDRVRYSVGEKNWYVWAGHHWAKATGGQAERLMVKAIHAREEAEHLRLADNCEPPSVVTSGTKDEVARSRRKVKRDDTLKFFINSLNAPKLKAALSTAFSLAELEWGTDTILDPDPHLLACANGVVDLQTGILRPGSPEDRITRNTGIDFNSDARCARFEQFLREVFCGDSTAIPFIARLVGYSLTGETREQVLPILLGDGCNGKSVFLETLAEITGSYSTVTAFSALEGGRSGASNDLAALRGARLVSATESEQGSMLNESRIKRMIGCDRVADRYLYQEFAVHKPRYKLWLAVNHFPDIRGTDDGIWRRLLIVPFSASFLGREDKELPEILRAEAEYWRGL
jgi:P4 family phage/plasmid primase-like protien